MPEKQWTMMVYLAGDNNLADFGLTDLKEMKQVGTTQDVNIVAQFDNGHGHTTKRYLLKSGTNLAQDIVGDLGPTNTGDPEVLKGFIGWATSEYPAKRYALVLWNHGAGWDDEDIYRLARAQAKHTIARRGHILGEPIGDIRSVDHLRAIPRHRFRRALFSTTVLQAVQRRGIAYDDNAKDFLDNTELKNVLRDFQTKTSRRLDVLGMDACLMSMAEVLYQVRDLVNVSVASEELEPGNGWPYDEVLRSIVDNPTISPRDLGASIVTKYVASYTNGENVTLSACDLQLMEKVAQAIDGLGNALLANLNVPGGRGEILVARQDVQTYETKEYVDLYDYCDLLSSNTQSATVRDMCKKTMGTLQESGVIIRSEFKGDAVKHSHGLSIYFPQHVVSSLYDKLDFSRTSWDDFLKQFTSSRSRAVDFRATA